ncbi:hypothetical protein ACWNT8_07230 [Pigmentibacter ruber]|nr:hypothetical protein GTC16762_25580 [Pigmentibacter ruber]
MNVIKKIVPLVVTLTIFNSCGVGTSSSKDPTYSADDRANKNAECKHIKSKLMPLFEQIIKLEIANEKLMYIFYTNISMTSLTYGLSEVEEKNLAGIMLVENSNVQLFRFIATRDLQTISNYCASQYMQYTDIKILKDNINKEFSKTIQILKNNLNRISSDINNMGFKNVLIPLYQKGIIDNSEGLDKYL